MATILHKRKAADPSASDLAVGELAINTSDGGVFTKTSGGAVVQLGGAGGGGDANQNAFSNVAVSGQTTVAADTTTDTLTLAAGDNISITTNATSDTVTIAATGATQFIGFSRESDGDLRCTYSEVSDSVTYTTSDYEHNGAAQWKFVDDGYLHTSASLTRLGSYTRPDGSTPAVGEPKYHLNSAGHLILTV